MFFPQLHPPSKTKTPTVLIQELMAILKFQVGGRGGKREEKYEFYYLNKMKCKKTLY